jgi:hypothetical protein
MRTYLSSRERLLTTIAHEEPDHVPLCFRGVAPLQYLWSNPFERTAALLERGIDDKITFATPWHYHPDCSVRRWRQPRGANEYALLGKEIDTPRGPLRLVVRETADYAPLDLPLLSDENWPRATEHLVKDETDLRRLAYLLVPPDRAALEQCREYGGRVKAFADERGVLVETDAPSISYLALGVFGAQPLLLAALDSRAFVEELLDMALAWSIARLEPVLDMGVDTVLYHACYETTAFWSPTMHEALFREREERLVRLVHQAGARFHYYMDSGARAFYRDFPARGFDVWSTLDPPPWGDVDVAEAKRDIGDRVCLWGGVDAPLTMENGSDDEVRAAVRHAIDSAKGGGGFVLSTADSIWHNDERISHNLEVFLDTWRAMADYGPA